MDTQAFSFAASRFVPVAIGFFGLGTGYFIWSGQALFRFPRTIPEVNRTMGLVGILDARLHAVHHGCLSSGWTDLVRKCGSLIMAGLAFTAFGIHWFAMAYRRYIGSSDQPDGWMAIAFLFLSILGADVSGVQQTYP
jgi:hypothetical protein